VLRSYNHYSQIKRIIILGKGLGQVNYEMSMEHLVPDCKEVLPKDGVMSKQHGTHLQELPMARAGIILSNQERMIVWDDNL
jgi:hypothetical protein